jgi:aspartyl-tRNA(Asn)/glutamyl-tRNA(Gln) amidotransferase subunit C
MIDLETVKKVANLARLQLTPEEEEKFTTQVGDILNYVEQLSELNTDDVEPTTRAINVSNVTRKDILQPYPDKEALLKQAPAQEGDFFRVPQIMG